MRREPSFGVLARRRAASHQRTQTLTGLDEVFFVGKDTVWAFASIANPGAAETVEMVWKQGEETRWSTSLEAGKSKGWRTWSRRTLRKKDLGAWTVEIVDAAGHVLGSIPFEVRELPIDLEARVDARIRPQASR